MAHADIHDLCRRLSRQAEAVCRHYLPNGCRKGRYWLVGDLANTRGRSLFVRLTGPSPARALPANGRIMLRGGLCCGLALGGGSAGDRQDLRNIISACGGRVMPRDASELARRLARDAEAVCRHYLSKGRRQGRYWTVGDVRNTPGRSMFVRLNGPESGPGAAGHWTDAASSEHGDLLDVIRESCGLIEFRDVAEEARRFLALPCAEASYEPRLPAPQGSPEAARRLWAMAKPLAGTLAEAYLHGRGIATVHHAGALRFHPQCYYRPDDHAPIETWPAMIAAVTDLSGAITGAHRTWLAPDGAGKAPIDTPRRAMGGLLGHAVRFGVAGDVLAVGEGLETVLSLRCALPTMPMAAALSASHLAALELPGALRRLYIARDADAAGERAVATLTERAKAAGVEALVLSPRLDDYNEDLQAFGLSAVRAAVRVQLAPQDAMRFMRRRAARTG